jgi:hypothetical protein
MLFVRRWLLVAALAAAGVWIYLLAGSGASLLALLDAIEETAVAEQVPRASPAAQERVQADSAMAVPPAASPAELERHVPRREPSTGKLDAAQIMRLLEDEIAHDTDPAAAAELLRAFGESLGTTE